MSSPPTTTVPNSTDPSQLTNSFPSTNPLDADPTLDADPDIDMNIAPDPLSGDPDPDSHAPFEFDKPRLAEGLGLDDAEARIPVRKDVSLREFISKMDDYAPIIPDAVTFHALTLAGLPPPQPSANPPSSASQHSDPSTTPLPLARLLALATQKFIADIAADAYQYSRMRSGNVTSNSLNAAGAAGGGGASGGVPVPGAAGGGAGTAGAASGSNAAPGGAGGAGGGAAVAKGSTGQHVLGMQRAGFGGGGQGGGQGRTVLTMEDLGMAVGEYGVNVRRGEFYR